MITKLFLKTGVVGLAVAMLTTFAEARPPSGSRGGGGASHAVSHSAPRASVAHAPAVHNSIQHSPAVTHAPSVVHSSGVVHTPNVVHSPSVAHSPNVVHDHNAFDHRNENWNRFYGYGGRYWGYPGYGYPYWNGNNGYYAGAYPYDDYGYPSYGSNYYAPMPPADMSGYIPTNAAQITVVVPDPNAALWFQGQNVQGSGTVRVFNSPELVPGSMYSYDVRAAWNVNGQIINQDRHVSIQAGSAVTVDFTAQ